MYALDGLFGLPRKKSARERAQLELAKHIILQFNSELGLKRSSSSSLEIFRLCRSVNGKSSRARDMHPPQFAIPGVSFRHFCVLSTKKGD